VPITNVMISTESIEHTNQDGSKGCIEVRGIAVADLMQAAHKYGPQLVLAFSKLQSNGSDSLQDKDVRTLIWEVSTEIPDVLAAVLAMAADEYNAAGVELMRKLPLDKQAEVMTAVFSLSFASEGSLEKLVALMVEWMGQVRQAMGAVTRQTSTTGTGDFAAA
jgi:hypothetical protein